MKRVLAYDGLRGWLLIVIACNHLYGGYVTDFTREPLGFVSAAEAFVFLSGFVAYLVYGRLFDKEQVTEKVVNTKIWHRCFTIYKFHLFTLLFTYLVIWFFPVFKDLWISFFYTGNLYKDPLSAVALAFVLLEQPGYFDILIIYLVPMTFLPFAIKALKQGKVYWVAAISFSVWILAQFVTQDVITYFLQKLLPNFTLQVSYFDPFAWQWLFYLGVLCSYLRFDEKRSFVFSRVVKGILLASAFGLMMLKHLDPSWLGTLYHHQSLGFFFGGGGTVPLIKQINLLLLAYCFFLTINKFSMVYTAKYPVYLGQHALPVFAFHTVVVYWLYPLFKGLNTSFWYWDIASCALFIMLLAIPAKLDEMYRRSREANDLSSRLNSI